MIYFTADTHFGHENILRFTGRPFASAQEMDEALIENWNARVHRGDKVYILGDMFFRHSDPESILNRLKGQKHLIIGNHDYSWMKNVDLEKHFVFVGDTVEVPVMNRWAVLSHYPMLSYRHDTKYYMIHGHIHNNCHEDFWELLVKRPLVLNAGVDINGFVPVTLPELIENNEVFKQLHPVRENNRVYDEDSGEDAGKEKICHTGQIL